MSNRPPFLPLEYCSIARAAKMLGCEIEDVQHWLMIGAMKGYVRAESLDAFHHDCTVHLPAQFLRDREYVELNEVGKIDQINYQTPEDEPIFSALCFTYRLENIKYYHQHVRGFLSETENEYLFHVLDGGSVYGYLSFIGFVEICNIDSFENIFSQESSDAPISLMSKANTDDMDLCFVVEYGGVINPDDIYIFREDLLRVYKSIRGNPEQPLAIVGKRKNNDSKNKQTSENTKLRALGAMAYLIAKNSPSCLYGSKPNAGRITDFINTELSLLGLDNVSNEIRKDISAGIKLVLEEIPDANDNS